jgi:hypothetical protein
MGTEHSQPDGGEQSTSKTAGAKCQPFGDPATARVFVIGHDPRLQRSDAQAETAFFLDYLGRGKPSAPSEARKYGLAEAAAEYVRELTGGQVPLEEMYFTNLCNQFLPHAPKGSTVLIPDEVADLGIAEIDKALAMGKPQVIIPMSLQVFYHLARSGFVAMGDEQNATFLQKAMPKTKYAARGAYVETGRAPFLDVCGRVFRHGDVPVVPVLHVKSWSSRRHREAYESAMQNAGASIQRSLAR